MEATRIGQACRDGLIKLYHVGSTSIPGIAAKPIIYIMGVISRHGEGEEVIKSISAAGYEYRGEGGLPGRYYFRKGKPNHSHHLHIWVQGHPEIGKHFRFRDYLRNHPADALRYEMLKRELAGRFANDTAAYNQAKTAFCD